MSQSSSVIRRWPPLRHLLLGLLVLILLGVGAGYVGLRHYLWPRLDQWRPDLELRISEALGRPVSIARIETGFSGLLPRLTLEGVRLADSDGGVAAEAARVTAVVSARTVFVARPRLVSLEIESPMLRVERIDAQRFRIAGFELAVADGGDDEAWLALLFEQRRIAVRGASVDWNDRLRGVGGRIRGIDLSLASQGRHHRIDFEAAGQQELWSQLRLAADLHRPRSGPVTIARHWDVESQLAIERGDFAAIARLFPVPAERLASVRGDLLGWFDFEDGRPTRVDLDATLADLDLGLPDGRLRLARLDTELSTRAVDGGYELRVRRLEVEDGQALRLAARGEQWLRLDSAGAPVAGRLSAASLDAALASKFARGLPLPPKVRARLDAFEVAGRVTAASGEWGRTAGHAFEAVFDFEALTVRRVASGDRALPWFANLTGRTRITEAGGEVRLRSVDATLAFPGIFEEPEIPLKSLYAAASWTVGVAIPGAAQAAGAGAVGTLGEHHDLGDPGDPGDGQAVPPPIEVRIAELRFENADAAGSVSGSWRNGGRSPAGVADLEGRLDRASAARVARYLPLELPADVRRWVAAAVTRGSSDDARFRLRGDLRDFPFERPGQGEFFVDARLANATLHYDSAWPPIEAFEGQLRFERNGMKIAMRSGRVFGVGLGPTQAVIEDFDDHLLVVDGKGAGPAADMIRFVNASPVARWLDGFTRDSVADGNARLELRLELPLDDLDSSRVKGRVSFQGNRLELDPGIPPFENVVGALAFSERGFALEGIGARFLDGPVRIAGGMSQPDRIAIRGEGRVGAQALRGLADNALTRALSGEAPYRVRLDVEHRASSLTVESELEGLASALPAPLTKAAADRVAFRLQTVPTLAGNAEARPVGDTIRVALGQDLRLALERERDAATGELRLRRGALALNAEAQPPPEGFAVHLRAPTVDLDAWSPLLRSAGLPQPEVGGAAGAARDGHGFSLLPGAVSVVADRVRFAGRDFNEVVLGSSRVGDRWRANVRSREVQGYFDWQAARSGQRSASLTARLTRLELPRSRVSEVESLLEGSPRELPALDVTAETFVLFDRSLGRLSLRARNGASGARQAWTLEELRVENPSAVLDAKGVWGPSASGGRHTTRLNFGLDLKDSGALLALFGVEDALRGGAGRITGDLRWNGSPLALDHRSLAGTMRMDVGKGQFLKTDPGIAKLIGVLNLQSLPRRLALDFRDVFAEGFAFDAISGDIGVANGIASTLDLKMQGVQAEVHIQGSADLAAETQDLEVEVRPRLDAGLASIAYGAIVNPVVGIGSFIAQMALRGPIEQILSYEYQVSGSWADPKVVEKRRPIPESTPPPGDP